jgi:hypothetical protein
MELKRRHYLFAAVVVGVAMGLAFGLAGQSQRADMAVRPTALPTASGSATVPSGDDLRRVVAAIFSRNATGAASTARMPLSRAFIDDKVMFGRFLDIAGASDVRPHVVDVRGRNVDLTIGYALVSDMKVKMLFTRRDTWTFAPGDAGWLLDAIRVNDKVFNALVFPDGAKEKVGDSRYDRASGSVAFSMRGGKYVWTPDTRWGWKIVAVSTPAPAPTTVLARNTPSPSPSQSALLAAQTSEVPTTEQPQASPTAEPSRRPTAMHVPAASRTPPAAMFRMVQAARAAPTRPPAYVAASPYEDCSTETIDSVSEDGSIVTLADGRRYLVREQERYLSSLWVAGDAVTLCDPGPGMNARLTHRSDVVYAGHLE